jgi:hypothetical protein
MIVTAHSLVMRSKENMPNEPYSNHDSKQTHQCNKPGTLNICLLQKGYRERRKKQIGSTSPFTTVDAGLQVGYPSAS